MPLTEISGETFVRTQFEQLLSLLHRFYKRFLRLVDVEMTIYQPLSSFDFFSGKSKLNRIAILNAST
jgi:hypothetical protein